MLKARGFLGFGGKECRRREHDSKTQVQTPNLGHPAMCLSEQTPLRSTFPFSSVVSTVYTTI
jgi:hypothetical protein